MGISDIRVLVIVGVSDVPQVKLAQSGTITKGRVCYMQVVELEGWGSPNPLES